MATPGLNTKSDLMVVDEARSSWRYGLIVVIAAIVAIVAIFAVAVFKYRTASDVGALVPALATSISTLAAAYFGFQIGSAGKECAEKRLDEAKDQAIVLAASLPPDSEVLRRIVRQHALQNTPATSGRIRPGETDSYM